jgi:hypothetical protein
MVNPRLLVLAWAGLALSATAVSCGGNPCTTSHFYSCKGSAVGAMTTPSRFRDATCPIRVDAFSFPRLVFSQGCYAPDLWNVWVKLPDYPEPASYPLPSSKVMVEANISYNELGTDPTLVEIYATAGESGGKAPSLRVTGGTIDLTKVNTSSGELSVNVQLESSIMETFSLVEQVTYTDCAPGASTFCEGE